MHNDNLKKGLLKTSLRSRKGEVLNFSNGNRLGQSMVHMFEDEDLVDDNEKNDENSLKEEKCNCRSWKRGVVVKILGRRIRYMVLENRLKKIQARSRAINIVGVGMTIF